MRHCDVFLSQCLYNQEQKGTISTLEAVDGLILACMGQKVCSPVLRVHIVCLCYSYTCCVCVCYSLQIFMWHFKDNKDLVGVAFIDTEIYIHTACAVKNFILIGDIARSVQLLRYQVGHVTVT